MIGRVRKICFGFICIVLLLPMINDKLYVIHTDPLRGYFTQSEDVKFDVELWMNGWFQERKGIYLNDNVSFRPDLIRLNAQINYSVFHQHTTGWGIFGKHDCLLDDKYVEAWNGHDFVGYDTIVNKLVKLKAVQDTFARMGKSIILVHAAAKGFYYADDIPEKYIPKTKSPTNFETYMHVGDSLGINQVDFNTLFCKMRDTSRELLYSKQGIHWTSYGGMLVADSLISYIEQLRNIRLPHMRLLRMQHTELPRYPDNDIAAAMNLIWPITKETFTYGEYVCDNDSSGQVRPKAIYIGDSFMWALLDGYTFDCINSDWQFWFYMKERHTKVLVNREPVPMGDYDWLAAAERADYVVLLYTASNLDRMGDGFIEGAYEHYFGQGEKRK